MTRARSNASHGGHAMTIAPTLQKHLDQNVTYDMITHEPTMSSTRTAQACHVPGDRLAKAIVLRRNGGYMRPVVPATHQPNVTDLKPPSGDNVDMSPEAE